MSEKAGDAARDVKADECMNVCPEFCIPILDHLQFLNHDYGFKGPYFKHVSRECWVTFDKEGVEIKIGYEPLSLPWGSVTKTNQKAISLHELMRQYAFHLEERKYREYDEISEKLFAKLANPREADEYALSVKEKLDRATAQWVKDIAEFFRSHLIEILP